MKDVSNTASKPARLAIYPRKRPSPVRDGAVAKSRRSPPRRTPRAPELQRIRDAQLLSRVRDSRLLEQDYRYDILRYMHDMEQCTMSSATSMDQQPEIRWHMRPCLVDFLVEVHLTFRLRPETLYLTLNIVDRYVSRRIVYIKHYQLVGCAALWIAAKFEDAKDRVPTVHDLAQICREAYDESAFIQMEHHVLDTIQWIVGHPTAEAWLRLACCDSLVEDTKTQHVARFLMEITLFYREFVTFASSAIATGALLLARYTCGKQRRPFEETDDALQIVEFLDNHLATHSHELSETLVKKYSFSYYSKASTHILQFYLEGRRFCRHPMPSLPPITPFHGREGYGSSPLSCVSTPISSSTSSESDDMPVTPTSPCIGDPFSTVAVAAADDKENILPPSMQMHAMQHQHHSPTKHVSDDPSVPPLVFPVAPGAVTFGRPKLNEINRAAPARVPPTPRTANVH
ncbi:cyclin-like protein [Gautieria morchelliformis]|nr:cyclin-like protein [Gautieria morchelliformis]